MLGSSVAPHPEGLPEPCARTLRQTPRHAFRKWALLLVSALSWPHMTVLSFFCAKDFRRTIFAVAIPKNPWIWAGGRTRRIDRLCT
ncbi:hypothetical protein BDV12DRAFT_171979 [Aspergillus spectabilis]